MSAETQKIIQNALRDNNPVMVQMLGLCPLLAVSSNAINALGLGLATIVVMVMSNGLVSLTRHFVRKEIRIPVFVLLIACSVTVVEMLMQAFIFNLYQNLGIYLALIVTNCVIIARAESYAVKNPVPLALFDGLMMGVGFALALLLLGMMREALAFGTLFAGAAQLFGEGVDWTIRLNDWTHRPIMAALPAGAFICYGLLMALFQAYRQWRNRLITKRFNAESAAKNAASARVVAD